VFGVTATARRSLRFESGGHRVPRPQDRTQGRIHTSAATVAIMPSRNRPR